MAYIDDARTQKANLGYIRNSMDAPVLDRDRELALARRWRKKKDEKALHELTGAYRRLVVAMAARFRNYGLPLGDLIQEGNIGLMEAAARFEPERGLRFSTYATWWIRAAIQDYVLRNWSIVRTGTTAAHKSLFFNLRRLRARIDNAAAAGNPSGGMTEKDRQSIAQQLGVRIKDVEDMEGRLSARDSSLNSPLGGGEAGRDGGQGSEWQDILADTRPTPEDIVIGLKDADTRSAWLREALTGLSRREKKIIRDRHLGGDVVTLDDLGKQLGISKERVRQLEARAMDKIRTAIRSRLPENASLFSD